MHILGSKGLYFTFVFMPLWNKYPASAHHLDTINALLIEILYHAELTASRPCLLSLCGMNHSCTRAIAVDCPSVTFFFTYLRSA